MKFDGGVNEQRGKVLAAGCHFTRCAACILSWPIRNCKSDPLACVGISKNLTHPMHSRLVVMNAGSLEIPIYKMKHNFV